MWHALVWALVAVVVLPWTLLCWLLAKLLAGPDGQGVKAEQWLGWLDRWQIPAWLADWLPMPAITQIKVLVTDWTEALVALLSGVPDLMGWLTPLVWLVWAIGAGTVVLGGVIGSVLVAALRKPRAGP